MKTDQSLKDSGLLIKSITEAIENQTKEQKVVSLGMLYGTLGPDLLGNILAGSAQDWRWSTQSCK